MAHIVAQHAGYSVFETNASDERSGNIVETRIRPAIESGAKIGSSKPNLVVIDEIDGAMGGADSVSIVILSCGVQELMNRQGSFISKLIELTNDKPRKKGMLFLILLRDAGQP